MTDESLLFEKKEKNWLGRLLKLVFFMCAFTLVGVTILANMGGSNDELKSSVEQFGSNFFQGRPTKIQKLVHMSFFPKMGFDVEGLNVLASEEEGYAIIHIGQIQAFMSFWDVVFQTARFSHFYLEDMRAIRGVFGTQEVHIDKVFIDHDIENKTAQLRGTGKTGVHPWTFSVGLKTQGSRKGKYKYKLSKTFPIVLDIADVHFHGTFVRHESDYYKLDDFELSAGDKKIRGSLVLAALGKQMLKLKGDISTSEKQTVIRPDVIFDYGQYPPKVTGEIKSEGLVLNDVLGRDSVFSVLSRIREVFGIKDDHLQERHKKLIFGRYNFDLDVAFKQITHKEGVMQDIRFPVLQMDEALKIGPVEGGVEMPAFVFINHIQNNDAILLIQDGMLDLSVLEGWLKHLPQDILKQKQVEVECGVALFVHDEEGIMIKNFDVNTKDSVVRVKDKRIPDDTGVAALKFFSSNRKGELSKVELDKAHYDFVQASLQSSSKTSPCASYIIQSETDEGDKIENQEVAE